MSCRTCVCEWIPPTKCVFDSGTVLSPMCPRGSNTTLAPTGATGTMQLTQVRILDIQEAANPATVTYAGERPV